MRIKNNLLWIVLLLFFSILSPGCAKKLKLTFSMHQVETVKTIDELGEPVSALVRVFQLRNPERFNQASVKDLFNKPEETLKEDYILQKKLKLFFNKELYQKIKVEKETEFVGIVAHIHRSDDDHAWRRIYGVNDKKLKDITIGLNKITPDDRFFKNIVFTLSSEERPQVNALGETIPALIRIFQLVRTEAFKKSSMDDLFNQPYEILGDDMVAMDKVELLPQTSLKSKIKLNKDTKYFGIISRLRKIDDSRYWQRLYGEDNRDLRHVEIELKKGKLDSMSIKFIPTHEMNADGSGNPLPTTVRIYQLKSIEKFQDAGFKTLWKKGKEVLEGDLVDIESVNIYPERPLQKSFPRNGVTRYIGLMGIFRRPGNDNAWKQIIDFSDKKYEETEELKAYLYKNSIDIQP